ncbi:MAG: gamma-glutamyltransferase [Chloroflexi bacterium]|nr:gamma-glutamyltransferase [Chloroflexota bacterium]
MTATFPLRGTAWGPNGCAAADHPLAASAGLAILKAGGSAADAAVAMAAVMVVVQPQFSNVGGDMFALTFTGASGRVEALNSSGPAPFAARADDYRALGGIPSTGPLAVTVPGCVDGWWKLHERHGRLPWAGLFEASIGYAAEGFPASRGLALAVARGRERIYPSAYFKEIFGLVSGEGGQRVVQPDLAATLQAVAGGGADAFYSGPIGGLCREALNGRGASFTPGDWQAPGRWGEALSVEFAGYRVHSQPPPSQGYALLLACRLYEHLLAGDDGKTPEAVLQMRASAAAFTHRSRFAADPDRGQFDAASHLQPSRAGEILAVATGGGGAAPRDGDTTYMLAVDGDGNAVSLIQSIFQPWGSGVMVPGAGIVLNNRMCGFTLERGHPNELEGGRRPNHTLHCYLVTVDPPPLLPLAAKMGEPAHAAALRVVGGTPGADRQVQTNLQLLDRLLRHGEDPQAALDAPRWSIGNPAGDGSAVEVETREPDTLGEAFRTAGHEVRPQGHFGETGKAYVAVTGPAGIGAAADLRGEGQALVY